MSTSDQLHKLATDLQAAMNYLAIAEVCLRKVAEAVKSMRSPDEQKPQPDK